MARLHMLAQRGDDFFRVQMMGFLLETDHHHFIMIDGGNKQDTDYFHGYIQALAGQHPTIDKWFLTHPHNDHTDVLYEMRRHFPNELTIKQLIYDFHPYEFIDKYDRVSSFTAKEMEELLPGILAGGTEVVRPKPGDVFEDDGVRIEILRVRDPELSENCINNSSMVFRVDVNVKSVLFLGDLGVEAGYEVIKNVPREKLKVDYIQMAHHGQNGANEDFYNACEFHACLWCTPVWLWNNDAGNGFNTHCFKTIETRGWMEKRGIKEHYIAMNGTQVIEL